MNVNAIGGAGGGNIPDPKQPKHKEVPKKKEKKAPKKTSVDRTVDETRARIEEAGKGGEIDLDA